jgi:predicted GTPase
VVEDSDDRGCDILKLENRFPDRTPRLQTLLFPSQLRTLSIAMSLKVVRIAVMGVTGAGKSSLIRTITGNKDVVVGHTLESGKEPIECNRLCII